MTGGRYKAYPEYMDSEVAWLRRVPSHWELRKSKYIFRRMQRAVRASDGVITAFRDGQVTLRSNRRTDGFTNALKEIGYQGVRKDDLLVHAMDGFAGAIGVSDSDGKCSPVCSVCTPYDVSDIYMAYYGYTVRQLAVTDFINSLAKGIRERSTEFRFSEFSVLELPVPPAPEQTKIAEFLDYETGKIDALIEKQQQLIALLKEKRQAVISHAVTKGLNPDAPMKDSGVEWLGEVPAHWEVAALKHLVRPKSGAIKTGPFGSQLTAGDMEGSEYKVYNQRSVIDEDFESGDVYISGGKFRLLASFEAMPGDLLVTTRGTIGRAAILPEGSERGILHPCLLRVQTDSQKLDTEFLRWLVQESDFIKTQLSYLSNSTTIDVIYSNTMASVIIPVPSTDEQLDIMAYLRKKTEELNTLIALAQSGTELLKERRTALISAAVTGKIDVRGWKTPESDTEKEVV